MRTILMSVIVVPVLIGIASAADPLPAATRLSQVANAEADILRARITTLESENERLRAEIVSLKSDRALLRDRLLTMKMEDEIRRVESGVPPTPPGGDAFSQLVYSQKYLLSRPDMNDHLASKLADKDKASTAEVVVRGILEPDAGGPGRGGWPTYTLVVAHVFKAPPEAKLVPGVKLTVKTTKELKGPVTVYLVFDKDQKLYRLQDPDGERGFSHRGTDAASAPAFDIKCSKNGDAITVKTEGDKTILDITSLSGIGGATIERKAEHWPDRLVLRLRLLGLESLAISAGSVKLIGGHLKQLSLWKGDKEGPEVTRNSPYWMDITAMDADGKPAMGWPGEGGWLEMTIPKALLTDQAKTLTLGWIDFYR